MRNLSSLYRAASGKERDPLVFRRDGESLDDCASRMLAFQVQRSPIKPTIGLLVIDEAHFLKNRVSFWGIGASLLGVHAHRTVTMSGTPYCNGSSDVRCLLLDLYLLSFWGLQLTIS